MLFAVITAAEVSAAVVTTKLDLVPADTGDHVAGDNELTIDFGSQFGSVTSSVRGEMFVDTDLDALGNVHGLALSGGLFVGSAWTFSDLSATQSSGTFETPSGDLSAVNNDGEFDATEHQMLLQSGEITKGGNPVPGAKFSQNPLPLPGVGTGTLTLEPDVGRRFNVRLELPVENSDLGFSPAVISGSIVAEGSVTAIPEASSLALLSLAGGGVGIFEVRRRRRRRSSIAVA